MLCDTGPVNCADCGAAMRLEEGKPYLICDYCRSVHFPEPNSDGVRVLGEPSSLPCPVCQTSLVHAAVGGERILYCGRCRGMLIPMDVFVILVQGLRARRDTPSVIPPRADMKDLERRISCPQCGQPMDTHPYGGPGNMIIDTCERCSFNWLDYPELQRIVRAPDRRYNEEA